MKECPECCDCPKCGTEIPHRAPRCLGCGYTNPEIADILPDFVVKDWNAEAEFRMHPESYPNASPVPEQDPSPIYFQHNELHLHRHESPFADLLRPFDDRQDNRREANPAAVAFACTLWAFIYILTPILRDVVMMIVSGLLIAIMIFFFRFSASADKRRHGKIMIWLFLGWALEILIFTPNAMYPGGPPLF